MSIATQITRIQQDRNTIRTKLVELGLATNVDNLDVLAEAVADIENKGAVSVTVKEGETYTIPKGYHSGSGTVSGVAGGGNYNLQSKAAVTPTKKQQQITPDDGFYGLSDVTIGAIPDNYQDVASVTAGAADVLAGKTIVGADGTVIPGSMTNNGAVSKTLDVTTNTYTIPVGYHNGSGKVSIAVETKSATPTKSEQKIAPTTGKVLSQVTVAPIPAQYQDVTEVDATAADVLTGKTIVDAEGNVVAGAMVNKGNYDVTLTPEMPFNWIPEGYHAGEGYISADTEEKTFTPTKAKQTHNATTKFVNSITINAIPDAYQDVTAVDATDADVLDGKKIVIADGTVVTGTMANNGDVSATMDGLVTTSVAIPTGFTTGGTISLTSDIEDALAAI